MNINKLFTIANAAKNIAAYDIANDIFAVIASEAIKNQAFSMSRYPNKEAKKVSFQIETEGDDLIESLSDPDGYGYYDLPRLVKWGEPLMGTAGQLESHVLCIPLPLVSRYFCNMLVRLMHRETHNIGPGIVERNDHSRSPWRLGHDAEKRDACYRDLYRRFLEEVSQEEIGIAKRKILRHTEPEKSEVEQSDIVLVSLKSYCLDIEEYAEEV